MTAEQYFYGIGGLILFGTLGFFFIRMFVRAIYRGSKYGEISNYEPVRLCETGEDGILRPVVGIASIAASNRSVAASNERIEAQLAEIAGLLRELRDREPGGGETVARANGPDGSRAH